MEFWDLYTEHRKPIGKIHLRGDELPDGCYHLVVHVWIKNSRDEYLICQRSENRPTFPLMWECVGGSVLAGETSLEGAVREVKEEVGLDFSTCNGTLVFTQVRPAKDMLSDNSIMDAWLFHYDGEVALSNATTNEVSQTRWIPVSQILKLHQQGKLVNTLSYFFDKIAPYKGITL